MIRFHRAASFRHIRAAGTIAVMTALAACGNVGPHQDAIQETARYVAHAKHNYVPPGPAEDPWGPYIREASNRFDVPETWVRSLMRVESGGKEYQNGELITSGAGAMGLMQVMPATYDELRDRYNLGDDPFNPHDNIIAGVAYMREMYEVYGSPGFLAAYNAGPARLDDYLANIRPLPDETRHYVAMIGPYLRGVYPNNRSTADQMAINVLPINIPAGKRYSRPVMLANAKPVGGGRVPKRMPVEVAQLPEPPRQGGMWVGQQLALVTPAASAARRFSPHFHRQRRRCRVRPARIGRAGPMGDPGRRLRESRPGAQCAARSATLRTCGAGGGASLHLQRASGPWRSLACPHDRDVA